MSRPTVKALYIGGSKEDVALLRKISPLDFHVDWTVEREDAIESARLQLHDVLLLGCNGQGERAALDILREVKRLDSPSPVIFLGARRDMRTIVEAVEAGCADWLSTDRLDTFTLERSVCSALAHSHQEKHLKRLNQLLQMLNRCNNAVICTENEPQLLGELCRIIVEYGGYGMAWLGFPEDAEGKSIRPAAWYGGGDAFLDVVRTPWAECGMGCTPMPVTIRTGDARETDEPATPSGAGVWEAEAPGHGFAVSLLLPIMQTGRILGALSIHTADPNAFQADEVTLLEDLAKTISRSISRIRATREQTRLSTAMAQLEEGVLILGLDWKIQYVNPACERMTGYSRDEITGKHPSLLLGNEDDESLRRSIGDTLRKGNIWRGVFVLTRRCGSQYQVKTTVAPIRDRSGNITNYMVIKRDVTQEMEMERQVRRIQKLEAIGTLAGGIAHEFNNMLGIIMGYTELALFDSCPGSSMHTNLGEIIRASNRMKELVTRILTFSRTIAQERKALRLGAFVAEVVRAVEPSFPPSVELQLSAEGGNDLVLADPVQLHQAVASLCANAVDAMRKAGGTLSVQVSSVRLGREDAARPPDLEPGEYVELVVGDSGEGIEPAHLERIFDPYFTSKAFGEGTGLGLSIVHGIVKNAGGTVTVCSSPGKGSVFRVLLPRVACSSSQTE